MLSSINPVWGKPIEAIETTAKITPEQTAVETTVAIQTIPELIAERAKEAGVNPTLASKIAFCESSFRQYNKDGEPLRGHVNKMDVGLFQINEKYHLKKSQDLGFDIYNTEGNIGYAMWLLSKEGSRHWNWSRPCWGK